jgi:hypothetical protein
LNLIGGFKTISMMSCELSYVWVAQRPGWAVVSKPEIIPAILPENIIAGIMPVGVLNIYKE